MDLQFAPGLDIGFLRRPRGDQTSFFQPVRLVGLVHGFGSPYVEGMVLKFTNAAYLGDFLAINDDAVRSGRVRADQAR